MPDVGILNLQIHDDSSKAAAGLGQLATKLEAVKRATQGIRLSTVATGLSKLGQAVNDEISGSTIAKLNELADALERISNASGNVGGIRISFGGSRQQSVSDIANQMQVAREQMDAISAESETMKSEFQEVAQTELDMVRGLDDVQEKANRMDFSKFDPSNLPIDALGMKLDESAQDWYRYGDAVKDSYEAVQQIARQDTMRGFQEAENALHAIVPYSENLQNSWANISRRILEAAAGLTQEFNVSLRVVQDALEVAAKTGISVRDVLTNWQFADKYKATKEGVKEVNTEMQRASGKEMVEAFTTAADKATLLKMRIDSLKESLARKVDQGEIDGDQFARGALQIVKMQAELGRLNGTSEEANQTFRELAIGTQGLKTSMERMFPTIANLGKRFSSLLKYRALRAMIKQISEGFKEGTENYYRYSQAVGGEFATNMDNAASSLLMMKNSIGAAAAPLISSLIPLLRAAVDLFIDAVNYANQFIALLRGQSTWSRATKQSAKAFDDTTKSAKGASSAVKDLLADWDELNIIQSQSGSGGAGSGIDAATNYANMFEEVSKFEGWIKDFVDGIKDQFGDVWGLVKRIGIAILGWKLSKGFGGLLGTLAGFVATGALIDLEFRVSSLFNQKYLDKGEIGWLVADTLTTLLGGVLMKKVLDKVLGGQLAFLAIPITLGVTAVAGIKTLLGDNDVSALSKEALVDGTYNAIKLGAMAGLLLKSTGYNAWTAIGAGAGASITSLGIIVGLKAINDTVDTGEITADTIKANFLSAGLVGAGLALSEAVLGGTIGTIVAASGAGAILTLGALFAIEAIIASEPKRIRWGNYKATQDEIKQFVQNRVFSVSARTVLSLINPRIQAVTDAEEHLTATAGEVHLLATKIVLGNSNDELKSEIEKQVFGADGNGGVLGEFKETAKAKQEVIEVGASIVPVGGTNDDGSTKALLDETSKAWKMLTDHMDMLGTELAKHLATAYSDNIDDATRKMELETVSEILEMIANVSAAVTRGESYAQAQRNLAENLTNLSEGSWKDLFNYIDEYKKELAAAGEIAYDEVTDNIAGQMFGLQQSIENEKILIKKGIGSDEKLAAYQAEYKKIEAIYKARVAGRKAAIEAYENNAVNKETMELIRSSLLQLSDGKRGDFGKQMQESALEGLRTILLGKEPETLLNEWFEQGGGTQFADDVDIFANIRDILVNGAISGFNDKDKATVRKAIDLGYLSISDFIDKEQVNALADALGIRGEARKIWDDYVNQLFTDPILSAIEETQSIEAPTSEINHESVITETITQDYEYETSGVGAEGSPVEQAKQEVEELAGAAAGASTDVGGVDFTLDTSGAITGARDAADAIESMASRIRAAFESLNGIEFAFQTTSDTLSGIIRTVVPIPAAASGAIFKSGDVFSANENGQAELIGRYGTKTAVVNNDQVVTAVSNGVANANGGVESRLGAIENLLTQVLRKEFVARAVPSTGWGQHNARSQEAYDRVTG